MNEAVTLEPLSELSRSKRLKAVTQAVHAGLDETIMAVGLLPAESDPPCSSGCSIASTTEISTRFIRTRRSRGCCRISSGAGGSG